MNPLNCLVSLRPLGLRQPQPGYTRAGIYSLLGDEKADMVLPFTRQNFIQEQPRFQQGMSISGYQPKLSLHIKNHQFAVTSSGGTFILKPSPEEYPHLAENEHATMTVMKRLKFRVPPFGLVRFAPENENPGELAYIIKRYDRHGEARLHQEQLDGAMGIDDKYGNDGRLRTVSYERICRFYADEINGGLAARREVFLRIVYAYVLGNNDYHLRNFGIIRPETGQPALAPVYDFVSVVPYPAAFNDYLALPLLIQEERDGELAPGLESQHGEYTGRDFILLAQGSGIVAAFAEKCLNEVITSLPIIESTFNASHMPPEHIQAVLKYVNRRINLLGTRHL